MATEDRVESVSLEELEEDDLGRLNELHVEAGDELEKAVAAGADQGVIELGVERCFKLGKRIEAVRSAEAVKRARWAHDKYVEAAEKAEGLRALRNLAILDAVEVGATQREVAAELDGMSQQAVGSIVQRTGRLPKEHDSN